MNIYSYCENCPCSYKDPTGEFFLSALVFIGVSALIGAGTGAYIAACDGGDTREIIESAVEGLLIGAAAATAGFFLSPVAAACVGMFSGSAIDLGVQAGSYYIRERNMSGFEVDVARMVESGITAAISASVPTFDGTRTFVSTAAGSTVVAADISILVATGSIIYHQCIKNKPDLVLEAE